MAFTTAHGLLVDFDCYTMDDVTLISETLTKKYSCGNILIMQSPWRGYMTLDMDKAYHAHVIFGARLEYGYIQKILHRLCVEHIIEDLFRFFHEVEHESTLRTVPKKKGEQPPMPYAWINIDGRNEVIQEYLEQWRDDNKLFREVIEK